MPKYRRAETPIATERQTQKSLAWSHLIHAHHYRSESHKHLDTPGVDRFFAVFNSLQVICWLAFSTWFMCMFHNYIFATIFGVMTLNWIKILVVGERTTC